MAVPPSSQCSMWNVKTMSVEKEVKSSAIVVMISVIVTIGQQNLSQLSHSPFLCFSVQGSNSESHSIVGNWVENYNHN